MKKKTLVLLGLLALLAAAGGLIWYLMNTTTDPGEEDAITAVSHITEDISSVRVVNEKGSFLIEAADNENGYACAEVEGLPTLKSNYISVLDSVTSIQANSKYPDSDLNRYGLDDPQATAEVTLKDGTSYTVSVGSKAPSENYIYFSVSDEPKTVYTARMSKFLPILSDAYSLVNKLLAPKTESLRPGNDETDTADWLEYTNADGVRFRLEYLKSSYVDGAGNSYRFHQTAPVDGYVKAADATDVFNRVMQFCASSVKVYHPTEADIAECGLDDPETELVLAYGDDVAVIRLSRAPNGDYYAVKEGMDVIWNIADYLVTWLDVQPRTMLTSYVLAPPMADVTRVEISGYGETYVYTIADGTGSINGKEIGTGDFKRLYELACSVNSMNPASGTPGAQTAEVRFTLTDGTVRMVTLQALESRTLAISVDGEPTGLSIRESYAETLLAAAKAVQAGEAFSTTW